MALDLNMSDLTSTCSCCGERVTEFAMQSRPALRRRHEMGMCLAEQLMHGERVISRRNGDRAMYVGQRAGGGVAIVELVMEASGARISMTDFSDWRRAAVTQESINIRDAIASGMADAISQRQENDAMRVLASHGIVPEPATIGVSASTTTGALTLSGGLSSGLGPGPFLGSHVAAGGLNLRAMEAGAVASPGNPAAVMTISGANPGLTLAPVGDGRLVAHGRMISHGAAPPSRPSAGAFWCDANNSMHVWTGTQWLRVVESAEPEPNPPAERPMAPVDSRRRFDLDV